MAIAWVKKLNTDYVDDPVFVRNFFQDFRTALGIKKQISPEDFDFTPVIKRVERENAIKQSLTKKEKKRRAAQRKKIREKNKEKFGYAQVDGVKVEIAGYIAEPSSILWVEANIPCEDVGNAGPTRVTLSSTFHLTPLARRVTGTRLCGNPVAFGLLNGMIIFEGKRNTCGWPTLRL
jgi:hypothetical protein